jgi:hypothetical protein
VAATSARKLMRKKKKPPHAPSRLRTFAFLWSQASRQATVEQAVPTEKCGGPPPPDLQLGQVLNTPGHSHPAAVCSTYVLYHHLQLSCCLPPTPGFYTPPTYHMASLERSSPFVQSLLLIRSPYSSPLLPPLQRHTTAAHRTLHRHTLHCAHLHCTHSCSGKM